MLHISVNIPILLISVRFFDLWRWFILCISCSLHPPKYSVHYTKGLWPVFYVMLITSLNKCCHLQQQINQIVPDLHIKHWIFRTRIALASIIFNSKQVGYKPPSSQKSFKLEELCSHWCMHEVYKWYTREKLHVHVLVVESHTENHILYIMYMSIYI